MPRYARNVDVSLAYDVFGEGGLAGVPGAWRLYSVGTA
jgi:hypothetical protein